MKGFLILIIYLAVLQICTAQKIRHTKADEYFNKFEYVAAADAYEKIASQDTNDMAAMEKLVICYRKLNDQKKAEAWLSKICRGEKSDTKYLKQYGDVLAGNDKHEASIVWYKKYLTNTVDPETSNIVSAYENMHQFYQDSSYYTISILPVNSDQSDFSPVFFQDGILFCSSRKNKNAPRYSWDNSAFIDLFYSKNTSGPAVALGKQINSSLHEGPATLSRHYDTLYFTRNDVYNSKKSNKIVKLKIYNSVYKDGAWRKAKEFELNNAAYSTGHPAISPDQKLYFVSDMPGGKGGTDLYWTKFLNGRWTAPVNLGAQINTSGNEMFPFVDELGNLYFASTTHPGLGGLDIFCAKKNGETFKEPVNLGYPVNSSKDDFGFIIRDNKGFFSSNRGNDPKDDNLYAVTLDKTKRLRIQATSVDGIPLHNYTIQFFENDQLIASQPVDEVYEIVLDAEKISRVVCTKDGYLEGILVFTERDLRKFASEEIVTISLTKTSKKISVAVVSEENKPLPGAEVNVMNLTTGKVHSTAIDTHGLFMIELQYGENYEITGSKRNYKTRSMVIASDEVNMLKEGEFRTLLLPSVSALFDKNEIGQIIEMDIKYDVGKFNIRLDAAKELDRLVVFLKKNPTIKIELGSHTDSRGSEPANLVLSQKRAASAAHYITSKGITSARIIPVGYGESDLKIKDAIVDEEHQQNRRTTVKVVGL